MKPGCPELLSLRTSQTAIAPLSSASIARATSRQRGSTAWIGLVAASALFTGLLPSAGRADPVTYANQTEVIPYTGSSATGGPQTTPIGSDFNTPQVVVNQTGDSIDLQFTTNFPSNGSESVSGQTAYAADIFLATGSNASANPIGASSYNFAITLGDQTANGGKSAAGLYAVSGILTSQNIWNGRPGFSYGGEYALASNLGDAQAAPVTMTSGALQPGWTVTENWSGGILDVDLTAANATVLATLAGMDDLFWATADCDNGPIFEEVAISTPPPNNAAEPGSLALLAVGIAGCLLLRRRADATRFGALA